MFAETCERKTTIPARQPYRGYSLLTQVQESRAELLQAFYKRFSGPVRALPSEPAGADAWRATTYGHGVLQTNPHGSALDQESPGSSPGGATEARCGAHRRNARWVGR